MRATSGPRSWSAAHDRDSACVVLCPPASRSASSGARWWRCRSGAFAAGCEVAGCRHSHSEIAISGHECRRSHGDRSGLLVFQAQAEHGLEVVRRELLESDQGLRLLDTVELGQSLGHDLGELLVLAHARDGDEVPLARDRIDLGDALDVREARTEAQALARRLDEDECRQHLRQPAPSGTMAPTASPYAHTSMSPYEIPWLPSTVQMCVRWSLP